MDDRLRRCWPPEGQILLLIAALAELETARDAWRQWNARQELAAASSPEVRLLASVARRMPELAPNAAQDPRLVGARRYIWTHTQMTLGTARPLLAALRAAGVRLMLIKGSARLSADPLLAQERALRDVDALVHPEDWERALDLALRDGWTPERAGRGLDSLRHRHAVGLHSPHPGASGELDLHRHVLSECRNEGQDAGLWRRAEPIRFLGIDLLRPAATDFALVTLAQSMLYSAGPSAAHWALDVDPLVRAGRIDWDLLLDETQARHIEAYVAAPLLMLAERIGCPIPPEVLDRLTRRLRKHDLVEFEARTTGYGPRLPEQFEATRILAAARAMRVARALPRSVTAERLVLPAPVRCPHLGPSQEMAIAAPTGAAPFARLSLHVAFDVQRARGHAYLRIDAPGLPLKLLAIPRAGKGRGGRSRRHVTVRLPACLLALRGIDRLRVRTNDRLEIRNLVLSWNEPAALRPLARLAMAWQRWRGKSMDSQAA